MSVDRVNNKGVDLTQALEKILKGDHDISFIFKFGSLL